MKIIVMGTGGVGGYYGGLLRLQGHQVSFIARGDHLRALEQNGLRVKSVHGDFHITEVSAFEDPSQAGEADLVLVTVKTPATEAAASAILPVVGANTTVLSLQNGIDLAERIGTIVGMEHMLGGVTWISAMIAEPGVIQQVSVFRRIALGELSGAVSPRVEKIAAALDSAGAQVDISEDIRKVIWTKFVFISAISAAGSLTRLAVGEYRHIPETRSLIRSLMQEVEAVGHAQGIQLAADVVESSLRFVDNAEPNIKASMQRDIENGRPSELDSMIAVIGGKGRQLGIPTPTADFVYAALLPGELKARGA